MEPIIRLFDSDPRAQDARRALADEGFDAFVLAPGADDPEAAVRAVVAEGRLPGRYSGVATDALRQGRWLVAAQAPFGEGRLVEEILESWGPLATEIRPAHRAASPAPFSDLLGIPVLRHKPPRTELIAPEHPVSDLVGAPMLSRNPTPLSSLLGWKPLSTERPWRTSFGLPLLSKGTAPLSSLLRLPTLSAPKRRRTHSFGLPLLSKNPAPLSALLGLPILTRRRRDRD